MAHRHRCGSPERCEAAGQQLFSAARKIYHLRMHRVKAGDIIIFLIYVALTVLSLAFIPRGSSTLEVSTESGGYAYSMDSDGIYSFPGPLGETEIEIRDGRARVVSSPCPGKTCIESGWSRTLCCLPNKVIAVVTGDEGGPDAVSG